MIVDRAKPQNQCMCGGNCARHAGVGALTLPSFDLSSIDWRWIAALAVAAFLIWKFARGSRGGAERRRQLRLARARYQMDLAKS
jgi:hypothetical protein